MEHLIPILKSLIIFKIIKRQIIHKLNSKSIEQLQSKKLFFISSQIYINVKFYFSLMNVFSLIISRDDTLEIIEPLRHSSSSTSLQREALDRLAIAMAKKSSSQVSSKESHDLYYSTKDALHQIDNSSKVKIINEVYEYQNDKIQLNNSQNLQKFPDADSNLYLIPIENTSASIKHPKQVYLKVSSQMMEGNLYQTINNNIYNSTSIQSLAKRELTFESARNHFGEPERSQTPELTLQINESLPTKESIQNEIKKRSIRQPTFGVSNSNTFTHLSSKMSSYEVSPEKVFTSTFDLREDIQKNVEEQQDSERLELKKIESKHSQESYLKSLKLRQQKFSNNEENYISPQIQQKRNNPLKKIENLKPEEEQREWLEIDVYMRNALWLSAKNNKVAVQQTKKNMQEMKECTFHPKLDEKTYKIGLTSPKGEYKSKTSRIEEKINNKKESGSKKSLISYQNLHGNKFKGEQQQIKEHKKSLNLKNLENTNNDAHEPKISVELREDGQKYYLL